jgi:hypothetical protein
LADPADVLGYPEKKQGDGAMFATVARGTYLLLVGVMIVAWALSLGHSDAQVPQNEPSTEPWSVYS